MKKKIFFILMSAILIFSGISSLSAYANSYPEMKLTPEQEKQAEEIAKEWIRFEKITSKLNESELERLFQVNQASNNSIQSFSNLNDIVIVDNDIIIVDNEEEIDILNEQLRYAKQPELPVGTVSVTLKGDNSFVATLDSGEEIYLPLGFWDTAWQVTKCAAHLTLVVLPAGAAMKAIKGLGGIKKTAQLLVGAGNAKDFATIAGGFAAEIIGIDGVYENCFQWD